ncbi:MAG: AAA family ATPase, partial [Bdellovibrionales bacterium]|nr:AAA family ATPase [Bdellovibrionales bacterium]
ALSLARHDALRPEAIWELKAQSLRKQNLLTLHRGRENFSTLGGLNTLKSFCQRALQPGRSVKARGALLLSPPGCGKSAFCRALGNEVGRPVLTLDIGSLLGGLVGDTERNIRQALRIADAMSPSILFVDELEKGLSGVGGTGDSGVSTRLFGTLLSWLADHESDVFFIGTANDISRLPPEFTRAERLDAVFFLDLPGAAERQTIWSLYRRQYDIPASQPIPIDADWTGAEIKSCCRLSALLDVPLSEAARNVVPVARTAAEAIESLRQWASGRCLSADHPGLYTKPAAGASPRRRVSHGTSSN